MSDTEYLRLGPAADSARLSADARLQAARIASVYARLTSITVFQVIIAGLIGFAISDHESRGGISIWLLAICVLQAVRMAAVHFYRADAARVERTRFWAMIASVSALFSGSIWGLGAILLISERPFDYWLWSLAIGGMCAGSAAMMGAYLPMALSFIYPACLLFMSAMFLAGTRDGPVVAILIFAFVGIMTNIAWQFSRQFGATLSLQFALERQSAELNRSNRQLSDEIEEHRKTAANLYQAQKMEALGKVAGGIAHDFNNLLTVILISLQGILKNSEDARIRSSAGLALEAANGGATLTAELLSFSRKEPMQPAVVNLNGLIEQFRPLLNQAVERCAVLEIDLAGKAMAVVDVAQFQSALINLVINARDAMDKPGRIMISTSLTLLDGGEAGLTDHGPGTFIKVDVMDTGCGMPPEVVASAFDPFFTTKEAGEGTGLGLAQVYGFARQAGGTARIQSIPGKGTCVTLLIPATEVELPMSEPQIQVQPSSGVGKQVLVVDDNTTILMMLRSALMDEGWAVRFAEEGQTALHILEQDAQFDLLISDINMPRGLNGIELARTVRSRWPHLGVLLISGASVEQEELLPGRRIPRQALPAATVPHRRQFIAGAPDGAEPGARYLYAAELTAI